MNYTDPKTKQTYYNLPVRQGPESVALEQIRLPFWYDGPQYEALDAGFGPYALSRLAGDTGGIYFVTRMGPDRISFDPGRMREYKPDWVGKDQYRGEPPAASDPPGRAPGRADHAAEPAGPALADLPRGRRARVQGGDGAESGDRRADRLHRRRGPGADRRRGQAPRPRELAPLAGPLRPDPGPAAGHEDPLLRVQLGLRQDEEGHAQVQESGLQRLEACPRRGDPLQREGGGRGQGGPGPPAAGRRRSPGDPLGVAGRARAERRVRLPVDGDLRPADRPDGERGAAARKKAMSKPAPKPAELPKL